MVEGDDPSNGLLYELEDAFGWLIVGMGEVAAVEQALEQCTS